MFKWACLGVGVFFLMLLTWMINDMRLQVRQSVERVTTSLPPIVERSRETTDLVAKNLPKVLERVDEGTKTITNNLPEIVDRVDRTTEVVAELSEDIRQLKELAGLTSGKRDENLVSYAIGMMKLIENSGGKIGVKKVVGSGLKNTSPAEEWAVSARKEALFLTLLVKSRKEMLTRIGKTKLGLNWYIELPGKSPVTLIDWLKEHHPETKALF